MKRNDIINEVGKMVDVAKMRTLAEFKRKETRI